jgi:hypothetical protein
MSFFGEMVTLVNRAPWPLNVRFDGKDVVLTPGENHGFPRVAVNYAKNQNPLMGSEHPHDPSQFQYLVGVKGSKDNCKGLTVEEIEQHRTAPQRLNRQIMAEERGDYKSREVVRGRKGGVAASNFEARYEVGGDGSEDGANYGSGASV